MIYYVGVKETKDKSIYLVKEIGYYPKEENPDIKFEKNFFQITEEQYFKLGFNYKIKLLEDTKDIKIVEKYIPEEEKSIPSEIEQLKKENEVLNDKVDNLKEALFELSLYTLKD